MSFDRRRFLLQSGAFAATGALAAQAYAEDQAQQRRPPAVRGDGIGLSALDFGADPSGSRDSTQALQAACERAIGGVLLIPKGRYRVSRPITIQDSGLVIVGESSRGETGTGSVLFKDEGFSGSALIEASGAQGDRLSGLSITGITVDGRGRAGSGISLRRVGNAVLDTVIVDGNSDWGIAIDGGFLCSLRGVVAIRNGRFDGKTASGGGIQLSAETRECADCRIFDSYANKNRGWQLRLAAGDERKDRVVGLTVWACQIERADHNDERVPVVGIEATDRTTFFGCNFVQPKEKHGPCLQLGGSQGKSSVRDVAFVSCCVQYNGKLAAIKALPGVQSASFQGLRNYGKGRLFDFDNSLARGSIYFDRQPEDMRGSGAKAMSYPALAGPASGA
ncbi:glycosyl hydrolase family 28-related protein [Hydrocarboniphaga effusa]|uniref:glycosyl hydrolase family 28-related protein n=2 Tax=Hydrocarboniphaga effusa TaxID=243629 RepID=UPI0031380A85